MSELRISDKDGKEYQVGEFIPSEGITIEIIPACMITKEIEFDAGHRVWTHRGKCRFPHGHRYKVQVSCIGTIINDSNSPHYGMLVDFGDLKKIMMEKIHDVLDHKFIVHEDDDKMLQALRYFASISTNENETEECYYTFPYIPTAENIARWCWEQIVNEINNRFGDNLQLTQVKVYETPTSSAIYEE